jgi:predicted PurR-regulated permease PerM
VFLLVLALFFAYVIAPLVRGAEQPIRVRGRTWRLPHVAAIGVVYLLLAGGASAGGAIVWPSAAEQLDEAVANGPAYAESFRAWERGWTRYYARLRIPVDIRRAIDQSASSGGEAALAYARGALVTGLAAISGIPLLLLVPVLAFFLLKDGARMRRTMLVALPHPLQLRGHRLLAALNETLAAYVRAQLLACAIVGVVSGVGFALIGTPYATLLGVLAAVLEFVPLVGPLIVAVVAITVAGLHALSLAAWTAAFLALLRVVQDYVIYPRLIGRDLDLHPLAIILGVLAGAELGGVAGVFVAVPVVALLTVTGRHVVEWQSDSAVGAATSS